VGMTFGEASTLLKEKGLSFGVVIAQGIKDSSNAFIFWQSPEAKDIDSKAQFIRAGQTMDIKLQKDRVEVDSTLINEQMPKVDSVKKPIKK